MAPPPLRAPRPCQNRCRGCFRQFQCFTAALARGMGGYPAPRAHADICVYTWPDILAIPSGAKRFWHYCKEKVSVCGCTKSTKEWQPLVENATMQFPPGSMSLLLGPPGSGKTTFLQALAGRLRTKMWRVDGVQYNGRDHRETDLPYQFLFSLVEVCPCDLLCNTRQALMGCCLRPLKRRVGPRWVQCRC